MNLFKFSLRHLTSLFILLCAIIINSNAYANFLSLTEEQINQYLAKKANIQDKFGLPALFDVDYKLNNLSAKVGHNNSERVELSGTLDGLFKLAQDNFNGKINLTVDTIPYYHPESGSIYLKDVRILSWSGSPEKYMAQLQTIMPFVSQAVAGLLNNYPIYTLDDTKPRDVIIKKFAKGIKVQQGRLELETNSL